MAMDNARLQIHFDIHEPIELVEFTKAMRSLADEYESFLIKTSQVKPTKSKEREDRLFITKIESNCILAELAAGSHYLGQVISSYDQIKVLIAFVSNIVKAKAYFIGLTDENSLGRDIIYTIRNIINIKQILSLVAKNKNGELRLSVIEYEEVDGEKRSKFRATFNAEEAKQVYKGLETAQAILEEKELTDYQNVKMYLHQVNLDKPKKSGTTGYKVVIEDITDKPLTCNILTASGRDQIRYTLDDKSKNPFGIAFIVDVKVNRNSDREPTSLNVIKLHEIINEV